MAATQRDSSFDLTPSDEDDDGFGYAPNLDLRAPGVPAGPSPLTAAEAAEMADEPPDGATPNLIGTPAADFYGLAQAPASDVPADLDAEFDDFARPIVSRVPDDAPPPPEPPTSVPPTPEPLAAAAVHAAGVKPVLTPASPCAADPELDAFAVAERVVPMPDPLAPAYRVPDSIRDACGRSGMFALLRRIDAAATHTARLGESQRLSDDAVRLWQRPTLAFAPADVEGLEELTRDQAERLVVNAFGPFGAGGPLPTVFVDYIERRLAGGDPTLANFINAFTHRIATLFYRGWAEHQRTAQYDRPREDAFLRQVLSLIGLGVDELRAADTVPDTAKAFFAGRLAMPGRNPEGLTDILSWFFGVPAEVEEFVPRDVPLPETDLRSLGGRRPTVLGRHAPLGRSTRQAQQAFRVRLGPMTLAQYERLLPDQIGLQQLRDWVRLYVGVELHWDVRLCVARPEVPKTSLGGYGRLGWTTWLHYKNATRDRADLSLPSAPESPRVKPVRPSEAA